MSRTFLVRLGLDLLAAMLLLFCMAYWWLGNVTHELAGTALFLLLIVHNAFNRRWYGSVAQQRKPGGTFNLTATLVLLVAMLVLVVTSILISNALSSIMSAYGGFTVRQIHITAAYWAVILVSIHLGLRWSILMGVARSLLRISRPHPVRTLGLRAVTVAIVGYGVWSTSVLALGTKLSMQMTLDWWNFEESVAGYFVHWLAVAGLCIALTYYARLALRSLSGQRRSRTPVAERVQQ